MRHLAICITAAFVIIVLANFQPKPIEYRIVDGTYHYYGGEVNTYYLWVDNKTVVVSDRYQMLNIMQGQGFELVTTYSTQTANEGGRLRFRQSWIFKR